MSPVLECTDVVITVGGRDIRAKSIEYAYAEAGPYYDLHPFYVSSSVETNMTPGAWRSIVASIRSALRRARRVARRRKKLRDPHRGRR